MFVSRPKTTSEDLDRTAEEQENQSGSSSNGMVARFVTREPPNAPDATSSARACLRVCVCGGSSVSYNSVASHVGV